jgi:hypothetical protein
LHEVILRGKALFKSKPFKLLMNNKFLLGLCLLLSSTFAAAQQTFHGFYINTNGDSTAVSFPNYKQWNFNPQQISVLTADGKEQTLTPDNTQRFSIEGYDTYVSHRFSRLTNRITGISDYRLLSPNDSLEEVHGFLLLVTRAQGINFYKYTDNKRENFFMEQEGTPVTELKFKVYVNDNNQVVEDARFKQQLLTAFGGKIAGNASLMHRLNRLEYKEDKLEAFLRQVEGKKTAKKKMYPSELLLFGGIAHNTFEVKSDEVGGPSSETTYGPHTSPVLGIAYIDYSQRNFGRNFFLGQVKWYRFKNSGTYTYPNTNVKNDITFEAQVATFGVGLGRNLIKTPTLTYYVAAVPTAMALINSKVTYSIQGVASDKSFLNMNVLLQTGLRLKNNFGIWAHYHLLPNDVQNYTMYNNNHRTIQIGVDWTLKRRK